jgi:hypothetical protein
MAKLSSINKNERRKKLVAQNAAKYAKLKAIEVNADFITVLGTERPSAPTSTRSAPAGEAAFATLTVKPWVPRDDPTVDDLASGPTLRQRISAVEPTPAPQPRGFLGRMFGRFRRR